MTAGDFTELLETELPQPMPNGKLAQPIRIADLNRAIENDDLLLHYQPQVDVSERWPRITGYEALSRWPLPDGSFVLPDSFIPLAEKSALIMSLDIWGIQTACDELARMKLNGAPGCLSMSANVSPRTLNEQHFAKSVADVLTRTGVESSCLTLEITERAVLDENETTLRNIQSLREIGISLSLDDFGMGYSSLMLLRSLPIQELKLDRSFVSELPGRHRDAVIVSATIGLASELGLRVVAEGVERARQADWLRMKGCSAIQGFLYGHPAPRLHDAIA